MFGVNNTFCVEKTERRRFKADLTKRSRNFPAHLPASVWKQTQETHQLCNLIFFCREPNLPAHESHTHVEHTVDFHNLHATVMLYMVVTGNAVYRVYEVEPVSYKFLFYGL